MKTPETNPEISPTIRISAPLGEINGIAILSDDGREHFVHIEGSPNGNPTPVRDQMECYLGLRFMSTECSCRQELIDSINDLKGKGEGVFVLIRNNNMFRCPKEDPNQDDLQIETMKVLTKLGVRREE
ncbi:MAG: hypothetical protein AAB414_04105 [Patescibacteria group bacterium]